MADSIINKQHADPNKLHKVFAAAKPFPHIVLDKFFDTNILMRIRRELTKEDYALKDSDLFSFMQSSDLNNTKSKSLQLFIDFLKGEEFTSYISQLTGTRLVQGRINIHSTVYANTNYLLCHDDMVEDRRIAVMIYLSDLKKVDGGALRLYDSNNAKANPKVIMPKFNRLALFRISKSSLHDVEETYTDAIRLTLGWWYYDK